jgi:hypothetical protein
MGSPNCKSALAISVGNVNSGVARFRMDMADPPISSTRVLGWSDGEGLGEVVAGSGRLVELAESHGVTWVSGHRLPPGGVIDGGGE